MRQADHTPRTVLHLTGSWEFYGSEQALVTLARYTDASRWHPLVGCLPDQRCTQNRLLEAARSFGLATVEFHLRSRYDPNAIRVLRRFILDRQVGLIHCHGYKSNCYGLLASRGLPVARISTAHGYTSQTPNVRIYEALDKWVLLRGFHRIIAVSNPIRRHLCRRGLGSKLITIPNALDLARFRPRKSRMEGPLASPGAEVIGSVGRLSPEKGHTYLLAAAPRVLEERPRARIVLVGAGMEEAALREQAAHLGIADRVEFAGVRSDVEAILAQFDVFVLPSLKEGLPIALLEAMAVGVPAVATSVGDVPQVLKDGVTGLLVRPGDAAALADAILRVLRDEPSASQRARAASALVASDYSARAMASRVEDVYVQALDLLG